MAKIFTPDALPAAISLFLGFRPASENTECAPDGWVQESGSYEREVKRGVHAEWNGWRKISGVICDRRLPARVKEKVYSLVVRPATVYGLEMVAVTKKQVEEMEVAEMKMLRYAMGVTRKDKIRNEYISTVKVERLGMKIREGRLRWYGHVMRRNQEYVGRRVMEMELPGKRKKRRPKRRFPDVVKEDMGEVGAREKDIAWQSLIKGKRQKKKPFI